MGGIAPFTAKHIENCAPVFVAAFNAEPRNEHWTVESARARLADLLEMRQFIGFVWIDEALGGLIGFAGGFYEQGEVGLVFNLLEFGVRPDRQRTGVGSQLLRHLEQAVHVLGIMQVFLLTGRGTPAQSFYERLGYRASPTAIVMSRRLD